MTIEEIRQAKREAEERIRAVMQESQNRVDKEVEQLRTLAEAAGFRVSPVDVSYVKLETFGGERRSLVDEVRIDLHL